MSDPESSLAFMSFRPKASSEPLRFVRPDTPPPFESRSLVLKQIDPLRLDENAAQAMTLFSSFFDRWQSNKGRDIEDAHALLGALSPSGRDYEVRADERANRRFSGDGYLSSSRYYSVCPSPDGGDGGTMARELAAYHDPMTKGIVSVRDATDRLAAGSPLPGSGLHETSAGLDSALLLEISPFAAYRHDGMRGAARRRETTCIVLPATVTEASFERLIDLRVPRVAEWFTYNLTRLCWLTGDGVEAAAFPRKPPLDHFDELLPSLTTQTLGGGNGATRIAGQWLRALGADAVVFPSARSNSSVEALDGGVVAFNGWNLVDYRGAHPACLQSFDLTPNWVQSVSNEIDEPPLPIYADVTLRSSRHGPSNGSWSWQKIEQANSALRSLASALHLYAWARGDATAAQLQLLAAMLGDTSRADELGPTADDVIRGLLGDLEVRQALTESVSVGLDPAEASLVDLVGTFRRMDARIAAHQTGS